MTFEAPLRVMEIDLAALLEPLLWRPEENGAHVLVRHGNDLVGRLWLKRSAHPGGLTGEALETLARQELGVELTRRLVYRELIASLDLGPPPPPSLTITVCTRNRPVMLRRCIESIRATCARHQRLATDVEILVVDNAPPDDATRDVVAAFSGVRYVREPVPGLDFARNRAIAECSTGYIAYIDDDAIADRHWLCAFAEATRRHPGAACITGAILPAILDKQAQVRFERDNGFHKGFERRRYAFARWGDQQHPCNAGKAGAGANMAFKRTVLRELGGFDEALDTGPPLPGGGDLDMFFRVTRAGYLSLYEPQLAVFHEHRHELAALRRQYYSWGLGTAAFIAKHFRQDRMMRARFIRNLQWLVVYRFGYGLIAALVRREPARSAGHVVAEFSGLVVGLFGVYQRSQARVRRRVQDYGA